MFSAWLYIMSNRPNGTIYIGVTTRLVERVGEHKEGVVPGFTKRYGLKCLVYYEGHDSIEAAIQREKTMKTWRRAWKVRLINEFNPSWDDLHDSLMQ
ncbi:MAG TPA: GIY-YIG nuclease family protein [Hyphomonadaceae bacterium]|nr:GIY-YIG nuclease family protein [Hyphomonadaceae bacterium]